MQTTQIKILTANTIVELENLTNDTLLSGENWQIIFDIQQIGTNYSITLIKNINYGTN